MHPRMDAAQDCMVCHAPVGIYPSGQAVIARFGRKRVDIVCSRCEMPDAFAALAPGALEEPWQSVRNR